MTHRKPKSKKEAREVDDKFENRNAVTIGDCHRADKLGWEAQWHRISTEVGMINLAIDNKSHGICNRDCLLAPQLN